MKLNQVVAVSSSQFHKEDDKFGDNFWHFLNKFTSK